MDKIRKIDIGICVGCIILNLTNNVFGKGRNIEVVSYILKNHFNDFLGGIAFLAYINFILSFYIKGPIRVKKYYEIFFFACLCSFSWEVITPLVKESTGDWWDFVSYTLGATFYWLIDRYIVKPPQEKYSNINWKINKK